MRIFPLLLLVPVLSLLFIPSGAIAVSASASIRITVTVKNPTLIPGEQGGGGTGVGLPTGHSSNDILTPASAPQVIPVSQPAAPHFTPSPGQMPENQPIPRAAIPPSGGVQPVQNIPFGQPASISATLASHGSILLTTSITAFAAVYAFAKRFVLSRYRTWITLYLVSMTGLLWTTFLYDQGGPLSESVFIGTTVVGLNLIVHILRFDRIEMPLRVGAGYGMVRS